MPRVAFFPDAFDEANGVARTSRALVAAAIRRRFPMVCIHGGPTNTWTANGATRRVQIARGRMSFPLEHDLRHDLLLWRHAKPVIEAVRAFRAT